MNQQLDSCQFNNFSNFFPSSQQVYQGSLEMSSFGVEVLNGVRVVRGPDWKWGDADGGEGNAGTVFTTKIQTAGIVNVVWDAGNTGQYRCGYQSSYDLRVY